MVPFKETPSGNFPTIYGDRMWQRKYFQHRRWLYSVVIMVETSIRTVAVAVVIAVQIREENDKTIYWTKVTLPYNSNKRYKPNNQNNNNNNNRRGSRKNQPI